MNKNFAITHFISKHLILSDIFYVCHWSYFIIQIRVYIICLVKIYLQLLLYLLFLQTIKICSYQPCARTRSEVSPATAFSEAIASKIAKTIKCCVQSSRIAKGYKFWRPSQKHNNICTKWGSRTKKSFATWGKSIFIKSSVSYE